jgi:hypothetical protein
LLQQKGGGRPSCYNKRVVDAPVATTKEWWTPPLLQQKSGGLPSSYNKGWQLPQLIQQKGGDCPSCYNKRVVHAPAAKTKGWCTPQLLQQKAGARPSCYNKRVTMPFCEAVGYFSSCHSGQLIIPFVLLILVGLVDLISLPLVPG